ncbi:hypothetical protein TNCV_515701 [Trichonephila clavipes]|nr:hypothetical protein TNCV_515701 [Trichonephila clavipes]
MLVLNTNRPHMLSSVPPDTDIVHHDTAHRIGTRRKRQHTNRLVSGFVVGWLTLITTLFYASISSAATILVILHIVRAVPDVVAMSKRILVVL